MAQRIVTRFVSDLSGEDIEDDQVARVDFTYRGAAFEIDLTSDEAQAFDEVMRPYMEKATKRPSGRRSAPRQNSSGSAKRLADIRAWARENGFDVAERGRVKQSIVEAYDSAH